jgi:hypothetical protein
MYATCAPVGDPPGDEIDAPRGVSIVRVAPVRGFTNSSPVRVLVVSSRERFARVSTSRPAR